MIIPGLGGPRPLPSRCVARCFRVAVEALVALSDDIDIGINDTSISVRKCQAHDGFLNEAFDVDVSVVSGSILQEWSRLPERRQMP